MDDEFDLKDEGTKFISSSRLMEAVRVLEPLILCQQSEQVLRLAKR